MSWTDERIEKLKSMWEKGMTASQIADELGGVSRNAVIGKAHRLDLQSRPSPVKAHDDGKVVPRKSSPPKAVKPAPQLGEVAVPRVEPPAARTQPAPFVASIPIPVPVPTSPHAPTGAQLRSIGPGGFLRQGPGDQAPPATPAPPRRLVPAKPSPEIAGKTSLLDLNDRICKWPLGHPGEPNFHFCGDKVNPGFPYCVAHCSHAYQAQMPRRDRKPPPPLPFGGPRVR
jgi:GcrA cell cycle regulator